MKKIQLYIFILILFIIPTSVFAEELGEINSTNAILYNVNEDKIMFEKKSNDKVLIASLTKIMTAIVSIENIKDLDEKVILDNNIFKDLTSDLSFAGFKLNEEVTYRDLLYGTLLPSGADATHSLAIKISGSEDEFIKLMNEKAKELNLKNTNFTNSIGIEDKNNNHYSTVSDVLTLLKYSLKNDTFKEIYSSEKYTTSDGLLNFESTKLKLQKKYNEDFSFITGSKTGYTSKAGLCLASTASMNGVDYILVTTGAEYNTNKINHFLDARKIYDYYFKNYSYRRILNSGKTLKKVKTKYEEEVDLKQNEDALVYMKNDIDLDSLSYEYVGKKVLNKNIKKGDKIGKYYIKNEDEIIYSEDIYSPISVHFKLTNNQKIFICIFLVTVIFIFTIIRRIKRRISIDKEVKLL